MVYLVGRIGDGRQESALKLMFPLRAGFEAFESPLDGEFDSLVIAKFKVQVFLLGEATPIAAEKRLIAEII
jgi:hypothetical protein